MWIARDRFGKNKYRVFSEKPTKLYHVDWAGDRSKTEYVWGTRDDGKKGSLNAYSPHSHNAIGESDSPVVLMPGEGPVEVKLSLVNAAPERPFQGDGI